MFKFLAKSAVASLIWGKYRRIIVSTAILFACYFTISLMHNDYLEYAKLSEGDANIALSYVFKWSALLLSTSFFYWANAYRTRRQTSQPDTNNNNTKHKKSKPQAAADEPRYVPDPFEDIRKKEKLSSKADNILRK